MRSRHVTRSLSLAMLTATVLACHTTPSGPQALRVSVRFPHDVRQGDSVGFHVVARNAGDRPVHVDLVGLLGRPKATAFRITIYDAAGKQAWSSFKIPAPPPGVLTAIVATGAPVTLAARQQMTWSLTWDGRLDSGAPAPPGEYTVVGVIPLDNGPSVRSEPARLAIRR